MSDKHLTLGDWKKFSKGRDLKEAALVKALTALEKAEGGAAADALEALDAVDKECAALLKLVKGNKEASAYLDEMAKASAKQRKQSGQAAQADAGDDDESPAALTTKMVPLLRQVRKGGDVQAIVATLNQETVVLLSRKAIGPSGRKLLAGQMTGKGTIKYAVGICLFEANAHTFVLQTLAAGMAKRIKAALLLQTEQRFKVRVRGDNPDDVDDDGDAAVGDDATDDAADDTAGAAAPAAAAPAAKPAEAAEPPAPAPAAAAPRVDKALQARYEAALASIDPLYLQALRGQQGDVSRMRALHAFAVEKAESDPPNFQSALQALVGLDKLLGGKAGVTMPPPKAPPQAPPAPPVDPAQRQNQQFNARLARLVPQVKEAVGGAWPTAAEIKSKTAQAGEHARAKRYDDAAALLDDVERLLADRPGGDAGGTAAGGADATAWREAARACLDAWRDAKDEADVGLSRLQDALRGSDDPHLHRIADAGLNGVSRNLQVGLRVALEDFAAQTDAAAAAAAGRLLRKSVGDFRDFLETDRAVELCDENPFGVTVALRPTLKAALQDINARLDAVGA